MTLHIVVSRKIGRRIIVFVRLGENYYFHLIALVVKGRIQPSSIMRHLPIIS